MLEALGEARFQQMSMELRIQDDAAHVEGGAELATQPKVAEPQANTTPKAPPLWDPSMFDSLSGNLVADVEVGLAMPILGRRRAIHERRLPIEGALHVDHGGGAA